MFSGLGSRRFRRRQEHFVDNAQSLPTKFTPLSPGRDEVLSSLDVYQGNRWELFRKALDGAHQYLEFGCGTSTEYVASNHNCEIRSVETDVEWAGRIQASVGDKADIIHLDLGPVGRWGRPVGYSRRSEFERYCEIGFQNNYSPEVVLLDGRFRVAVFMTALLRTAPGTALIFDDYPVRPYYHVVEEVISPSEVTDYQAKFVTPKELNEEELVELWKNFLHVME